MKTLIQDLHLYELVLLFLGVALFLILIFALIYYILKNQEIKKLLYFFPIPIIMIAYPSIQEINISKDKLALTKYQQEVKNNPNDTIARQELEELSEKLEKRASTPKDILEISKAQLVLGNSQKAIYYANKATEVEKERAAQKPNKQTVAATTAYANELKNLAKIQEQYKAGVDTSIINAKIKNMNIDPRLFKKREFIKLNQSYINRKTSN